MPQIVLGLSKPLTDANAQIAMELPFHPGLHMFRNIFNHFTFLRVKVILLKTPMLVYLTCLPNQD